MRVGIVGHEAAKFTRQGEEEAKVIIRDLLREGDLLVSGGCHLGGIDIWAEEIQRELGQPMVIHKPHVLAWPGYRKRNLLIVRDSDIVHCLAVRRLAGSFVGMRRASCYHCGTDDHMRGGGCWTMKQARLAGKKYQLHILDNREDIQT